MSSDDSGSITIAGALVSTALILLAGVIAGFMMLLINRQQVIQDAESIALSVAYISSASGDPQCGRAQAVAAEVSHFPHDSYQLTCEHHSTGEHEYFDISFEVHSLAGRTLSHTARAG